MKNSSGFYKKTFDKHPEDCLKDLLRYAKYFQRCTFDVDTRFSDLGTLDKKFYELTYLLKADASPIILMYLLQRYERKDFTEDTFIKFIDALISLAFRSKLSEQYGIVIQFAGNILQRLDNAEILDEKIFYQAITFGKGKYSFTDDETFRENLINKNIYEVLRSQGCKYLLYSLERAIHPKELPSYAEATVEHIMPQKFNKGWENILQERDDIDFVRKYLHTLGNLTLTGENSKLSNALFEEKKQIYQKSNFTYTRDLTNYNEWTSQQILDRAKRLANEALKIWAYPTKIETILPRPNDVITLDADFNEVTGLKPDRLFIGDKEIKISHWKGILKEVIQLLYDNNKNIFCQVIQRFNVRKTLFTSDPTKLRMPLKIDEKFFFESNHSARDLLRIIKTLVINFDELNGSNFKDEIYFTVRHD